MIQTRTKMTSLVGKLVDLIPQSGGFQSLNPGEYGIWKDDTWFGCTPNDEMCWLKSHQVTKNSDGTITVTPSILVSNSKCKLWHGYLTNGVWTTCEDSPDHLP